MLARALRTGFAPVVRTTTRAHSVDVSVCTYPGSRILEMQNDCKLSTSVTNKIQNYLKLYSDNDIVDVVMFGSGSSSVFSHGYKGGISVADLESAHALADSIAEYPKVTIACYTGKIEGSAYSIFANSKYRLGSEKTVFNIPEIVENNTIPIGGLAFHLVKAAGAPLTNFLALTGSEINVVSLLELGLITHYAESYPQHSIGDALAHTIPESQGGNAQGKVVSLDGLDDMIDIMDVRSDIEIADDPIWNDYMVVPTQQLLSHKGFGEEIGGVVVSDDNCEFRKHSKAIAHCFAGASVLEIRQRLLEWSEEGDKEWAAKTAENLSKLNPIASEAWLRLTQYAQSGSLSDNLRAEKKTIKALNKV